MSTEPDAPLSDDDATREEQDNDATPDDDAERARAKRIDADLALLRDILDFHGKYAMTYSFVGTEREAAILARLGMTPRHSPDPVIRQKRRNRMYYRVNAAQVLLHNVLHAIRTNDHGAWLTVELAFSDYAMQRSKGIEKKIIIGAILEIIGDARQELSRIPGFDHLAPGWRDYDIKGSKKPKRPTPTDPESLEHVRTIAAQLRDDLISIDRCFAHIEIDRVAELLQENTTLERVAGYLVHESNAMGYEGQTPEQLIKNFEEVNRAIRKDHPQMSKEAIEVGAHVVSVIRGAERILAGNKETIERPTKPRRKKS